MQISISNGSVRQQNVQRPLRSALLSARLAFYVLAASASALIADDERIPKLTVGSEVYSNVVVTSVTATDIYFTHLRGIGNAKLKNLEPELQRRFHFDPVKAAEREKEQAKGNAQFLMEVSKPSAKPAPKVTDPRPIVTVKVAEPTIEYNYYSLGAGKPPEVHEGMLGVTDWTNVCSPEITMRSAGTNVGGLLTFEVESVNISIELRTSITLPNGFSQLLRDHEEGHRAINEHFYSYGRKAAEYAGKSMFRRLFAGSLSADKESSEATARSLAIRAVRSEYFKYTFIPCRAANSFYDELTDHGRNSTNSTVAVSQAIEQFDVRFPPEILESGSPAGGKD